MKKFLMNRFEIPVTSSGDSNIQFIFSQKSLEEIALEYFCLEEEITMTPGYIDDKKSNIPVYEYQIEGRDSTKVTVYSDRLTAIQYLSEVYSVKFDLPTLREIKSRLITNPTEDLCKFGYKLHYWHESK